MQKFNQGLTTASNLFELYKTIIEGSIPNANLKKSEKRCDFKNLQNHSNPGSNQTPSKFSSVSLLEEPLNSHTVINFYASYDFIAKQNESVPVLRQNSI